MERGFLFLTLFNAHMIKRGDDIEFNVEFYLR